MTTAVAQNVPTTAGPSLRGFKVEIQTLTKETIKPEPKKDLAMEKMVEVMNQVLSQAISVDGKTLPEWTGVQVKSKGYLIYLHIPGYKRTKFVQKDGKWEVVKKDGQEVYTRKSNVRIPLMNAKDFIPLTVQNHTESIRFVERLFTVAPYVKAMLEVVLNKSEFLREETERRIKAVA
jgi:hypothetical protein